MVRGGWRRLLGCTLCLEGCFPPNRHCVQKKRVWVLCSYILCSGGLSQTNVRLGRGLEPLGVPNLRLRLIWRVGWRCRTRVCCLVSTIHFFYPSRLSRERSPIPLCGLYSVPVPQFPRSWLPISVVLHVYSCVTFFLLSCLSSSHFEYKEYSEHSLWHSTWSI